MFINFFFALKKAGLPVSIGELLDLIEAVDKKVIFASIDDFYQLSRLILIKNEKYYDRFDQVFNVYFNGIEEFDLGLDALKNMPRVWLFRAIKRYFSQQEMNKIRSQGNLEELLELFKKRLQEQKERHEGGNRWIGTSGSSPFGAFGYNPEGFRIAQGQSHHRRAIKVWEKREFEDLDEDTELNHRNIQVALRHLRVFSKDHTKEIFDLPATIQATAKNSGYLNIQMQFERRNAVKILLLLDIGGSMDDYVYISRNLFTALKNEFKNMAIFYFHNCVYEALWKSNYRRQENLFSTEKLIRKYGKDYKVIFVGDASMSLYEIIRPGGSVEHFNAEAGIIWMRRILSYFDHTVWLNPVNEGMWSSIPSIGMVRQLLGGHMFPLTANGIMRAMKAAL